MKKVFNFIAMAVVVLSLGLSGCAKEDPASALEVKTDRTGTVAGYIVMKKDTKTDSQGKTYYSCPDAVTISASVTYASLTGNAKAKGSYDIPASQIKYDSSTGYYTITVPVGIDGSKVNVVLSDITGKQTQVDPSDNTKSVDVDGVYQGGSKTFPEGTDEVLYAGQTKDITTSWDMTFKATTKKGNVVTP